ncbi:MAG: hypothetical protein AAF721_03500 [Myxococcota bacterium]
MRNQANWLGSLALATSAACAVEAPEAGELRDSPAEASDDLACGTLDVDGDGELGFGDFLIVSDGFGETTDAGLTIDFDFFLQFSNRFGESCGTGSCEAGTPPPEPAPAECDNTCVPVQLYAEAATREYYNECRNYCHADNHCYDRAQALNRKVHELCDSDIAGPDGVWCDEFPNPASAGSCDDLMNKVIIRYPCGSKWRYHIATVAQTCEHGACVIDPLGDPNPELTGTCLTPQQWCEGHAGSNTVLWHDTNDQPPAGQVYCELAPGDQANYRDDSKADPREDDVIEAVCDRLEAHTDKLCRQGATPYPSCMKDSDGDGIPDDYDMCPDSDPGDTINYCDPLELGCATEGAGCPVPEEYYSIRVDWERVADADYDERLVYGEIHYETGDETGDDAEGFVATDTSDLSTQCGQPDSGTYVSFGLPEGVQDDADVEIWVYGVGDPWAGEPGASNRSLICTRWLEAPDGCGVAEGEEPSDDAPSGTADGCRCQLTKGELDEWIADGHTLAVEVLSTDLNYGLSPDGELVPPDREPDPPLACKGEN